MTRAAINRELECQLALSGRESTVVRLLLAPSMDREALGQLAFFPATRSNILIC